MSYGSRRPSHSQGPPRRRWYRRGPRGQYVAQQRRREGRHAAFGRSENVPADRRAWVPELVCDLQQFLENLVRENPSDHSLLVKGLEPIPDGWRACAPKRDFLPRYPMILHRGGFPDGG